MSEVASHWSRRMWNLGVIHVLAFKYRHLSESFTFIRSLTERFFFFFFFLMPGYFVRMLYISRTVYIIYIYILYYYIYNLYNIINREIFFMWKINKKKKKKKKKSLTAGWRRYITALAVTELKK